jgi:hypothetical protein
LSLLLPSPFLPISSFLPFLLTPPLSPSSSPLSSPLSSPSPSLSFFFLPSSLLIHYLPSSHSFFPFPPICSSS